MVIPFICGTFQPETDQDDQYLSANSSPNSTPKKSRSKNKNPFSTVGLDKFSALVAELEEKRQMIYSQKKESEDIVLVRFVYKSNECVPVVVKQKDRKEEQVIKNTNNNNNNIINNYDGISDMLLSDSSAESFSKLLVPIEQSSSAKETQKKKRSFLAEMTKLKRWRRPTYYLPAVFIFILLLLTVFGRSVAVLCTCICWYLIPLLKESSNSSSSRPTKKKEYTRRLSEKSLLTQSSIPKKNNSGNLNDKSSQAHGSRKSW